MSGNVETAVTGRSAILPGDFDDRQPTHDPGVCPGTGVVTTVALQLLHVWTVIVWAGPVMVGYDV